MMSQTSIGLVIVGVFLGTTLGTFLMLKISNQIGLKSQPNNRSSHNKVTPHGGGLGFVLVFLFTLFVLFLFGNVDATFFFVFVGCGGVVAGMGFLDDVYHIAARWRFSVYLSAVTFGVVLWGGLPPVNIANQSLDFGLLGDIGAVFLLLWWLNLYNFMDGIDGLAAVEALSISLGAALLIWLSMGIPSGIEGTHLLLLLLAASVLGFLVWNKPPAKIFMGDVGSTFLGFALGMLAVGSMVQELLSPWAWLILGGAFIVDATVTLLWRMISGGRWYEAHRSHAYQHAANRLAEGYEMSNGLKPEESRSKAHGRISLGVLFLNTFWLLPIAYAAQSLPSWGIGFVVIAWLPLVLLALYLGAGRSE